MLGCHPSALLKQSFDGNRYRLEEFYDLETLWQIYFRRVYTLDPSDRVIVDAGANIGLFSCFAAASLPECRVYSVEPFPPTYGRLEAHVKSKGLSSRVRCFQKALAGEPGHVTMATGGNASQMVHIVQEGRPSTASRATVEVEAVTLGQFLSDLNEPAIDLLKMDIEGSECDVLLATSPRDLESVKRINLEYHARAGVTKADLVAHLAKSGSTSSWRMAAAATACCTFPAAQSRRGKASPAQSKPRDVRSNLDEDCEHPGDGAATSESSE